MPSIKKKQSPARIIALGFLLTILVGSLLLMLPFSTRDGVQLKYIDSLFTSASAVCVTGLVTVDTGDTFTVFGQIVLLVLIQIGGLGVASIGAGIMLVIGKRLNMKEMTLVRESMNLDSGKGVIRFLRSVFVTALAFELAGAVLSFFVFLRDYSPLAAAGISIFHSVAAFNNSGFDILGNFQNMLPYKDNIALNLITCVLVFFGGIGFLVIRELLASKFRWKKLSMHSKVVLSVSGVLIVSGALLLKLTENISWLGAFFQSVSARTAGFATYPLGELSGCGIIVMIILMFIGSSPGSTGGGIKTSTFFVLLQGVKSAATNKSERAFHYSVPKNAFRKAAVIAFIGISVILTGSFLMSLFEPELQLPEVLFEVTSAFATVGLSMGITPSLGIASKILLIIIMYIGRLGPLTVATLWHFGEKERVGYPDGNIAIG